MRSQWEKKRYVRGGGGGDEGQEWTIRHLAYFSSLSWRENCISEARPEKSEWGDWKRNGRLKGLYPRAESIFIFGGDPSGVRIQGGKVSGGGKGGDWGIDGLLQSNRLWVVTRIVSKGRGIWERRGEKTAAEGTARHDLTDLMKAGNLELVHSCADRKCQQCFQHIDFKALGGGRTARGEGIAELESN